MAGLLSALGVACSDSGGANTPNPPADSGADLGAADTGAAPQDTGAAPQDTGAAPQDTGAAPQDTGALDAADASAADTGAADTGAADTGTADVPEDRPFRCATNADCTADPAARVCDVATGRCVGCAADGDCAPGTVCTAGACAPGCNASHPCPTGQGCCAGACLDTRSSADNCGACGNRCMTANGMPACVDGRCAVGTCATPFADCDRDAANGCEVDTGTTTAHCGTCGMACPAGPNATATCAAGRCGITCAEGFADCDGGATNGCETDTRTSAAHCGACNNACPAPSNATATCAAGRCGITCAAGFADCDGNAANGCETDTRTTPMHCGGCGMTCAAGGVCVASGCVCPGSRSEVCDGACRDLSSDPAHCGACNNRCAADESCIVGGASTPLACRPACFITVTRSQVPGTGIQVGFDPAWGPARLVTGTSSRGAVLLDDATARVAGGVFGVPSVGADARTEATRIEGLVTGALGSGVSPVLVGRAFTAHEGSAGVASTYRVLRATNASALRDGLVMSLIGVAAPAGGPAVGPASEFLVEVTTVRRTAGSAAGRTDVIVAVAPRADMDDATRETAIRAADLVNATGVAEVGRELGFNCETFRTEVAAPVVDFLWTVDTSGSMGTYQNQVGRAADAFFARMRAAGLDFRVGVLQASYGTLNIDSPGFTWIPGTDAAGGRRLCDRVTYSTCPLATSTSPDRLSPYTFGTGTEQPTAAAVIGHDTFNRRATAGETNPERRLRAGARFVSVFVTDEPGSNDFRYFSTARDPQTSAAFGSTYNATTLGNIVAYFRRNSILTFGIVPVDTVRTCSALNVADLPRCVIEGNGGSAIPIGRATDADVAAALNRIVDAIGGATSQYRLSRTPITSMIRVRLRGADVPRSRTDGFDYDPSSRSIVFYGSRFRPRVGDEVTVSYRVWEGSGG